MAQLDLAVGSNCYMCLSLTFALHHTVTSFAESQMMTNVLAEMAEEVEAATPMALQLAKATDLMGTRELENLLASLIWERLG